MNSDSQDQASEEGAERAVETTKSTRRAVMGTLLAGTVFGIGSALVGAEPAEATRVTPSTSGVAVFGFFDVTDFGALGNDNPSSAGTNATAFASAIAALTTAGGGVLYVPSGVYYLNAKLNIQNVAIAIKGNGRHQSVLVWTNNNGGIDFSVTDGFQYDSSGFFKRGRSLLVEGLTIATTVLPTASGSLAGNAIRGAWQDSTTMESYFQARDLKICGYGDGRPSWNNGIALSNANGSRINDVYIVGNRVVVDSVKSSPMPWAMANAILYTGTSSAGKISHFLQGIGVERANTAIAVDQWYEGFYMSEFELVYVGTGFFLSSLNSPNSPEVKNPNFFAHNGHLNFRKSGVDAIDILNVRLVNVDFFKEGDGVPYSIAGNAVGLTGCDQFLISGCKFESATQAGTSENAIYAKSSSWGTITGCIVKSFKSSGIAIESTGTNINANTLVGPMGTGIYLAGTSAKCRVDATIYDSLSTNITNSGTGNVVTA